MDIKQIKELIQIFEKSGVHKLTIKDKSGLEVTLEKASQPIVSVQECTTSLPQAHGKKHPPISTHPPEAHTHKLSQEEDVDPKKCIKSPMVGTFYRSESPGSKSYTDLGEQVTGTIYADIWTTAGNIIFKKSGPRRKVLMGIFCIDPELHDMPIKRDFLLL